MVKAVVNVNAIVGGDNDQMKRQWRQKAGLLTGSNRVLLTIIIEATGSSRQILLG